MTASVSTITMTFACILMLGCVSSPKAKLMRYIPEEFPPSSQVEVFRRQPIERNYLEIGEISIRLKKNTEETAITMLRDKAAMIGADAIILMGERNLGSAIVPVGSMYMAMPMRDIYAIAIKYKSPQNAEPARGKESL